MRHTRSLGNISKGNKYWRILRELQIHMQFHASSDKNGIRQDYLPVLLPLLINPLRNEEQNVKYSLLRSHIRSII